MLSLRSRFTYSNVVVTLALVFAMSGGALAASKFLITSTKQIKPSVLASLKGKAGPAGAAGTQGATGPVGPQGPAGKEGVAGTTGKDGVSVTGAAASSAECAQGGVRYTSASGSNAVCNGKNGTTGFTETLPSKKTETGTWAFGPEGAEAAGSIFIPIASFSIPLSSPLGQDQVHYINSSDEEVLGTAFAPSGTQSSTECPGTAAKPSAEPGNLCIYEANAFHAQGASGSVEAPAFPPTPGAWTSGAIALFSIEGFASAYGTWAVTAE
jgi:hypothetical protein